MLRFRRRFWETISPSPRKTLSKMSFLFSQDDWFPTWWTSMPEKNPTITAWAPFRSAEKLSGQPHEFVVERALHSLSGLLGVVAEVFVRNSRTPTFTTGRAIPFRAGPIATAKLALTEPSRFSRGRSRAHFSSLGKPPIQPATMEPFMVRWPADIAARQILDSEL